MTQQIDSTINEHPPEVRVLPLPEQVDAGLDAHLGTAVSQFRELLVGQAAEQADSAKVVGAHHIVAWSLIRSAFGWPRRLPPRRGCRDRYRRQPLTISARPITWADSAWCGAAGATGDALVHHDELQ